MHSLKLEPKARGSVVLNEAKPKINYEIDLETPKVVTNDKLAVGDKKVYCRCWRSKTFPLCDGAHVDHNKECEDNVGPLIVAAEAVESEA
eukprot:CAMPEP_0113938598 /NCGR_PEP_ID=MMETSP1339-20121228/5015_1 /TAXON_ID=94617 /ORGANISM="Fibrocapsa japonica" /LENGTH=89 /DNA_ID=CAMNT_0000941785 /DNA_START=142 /DNA_END=411 /DNA_ORIENTATION=- /assembly_acc=CAM_ASM_000762